MIDDKALEVAVSAALRANIIVEEFIIDGKKVIGEVKIDEYLQYSVNEAIELGVTITEKTEEGEPRWHWHDIVRGDEYDDTNRAILRPVIKAAIEAYEKIQHKDI